MNADKIIVKRTLGFIGFMFGALVFIALIESPKLRAYYHEKLISRAGLKVDFGIKGGYFLTIDDDEKHMLLLDSKLTNHINALASYRKFTLTISNFQFPIQDIQELNISREVHFVFRNCQFSKSEIIDLRNDLNNNVTFVD